MKDQRPKISEIRHDLADVLGGLTSATDLLKVVPGASTVQNIVQLAQAKVRELLTSVDKEKVDLVGSYVLENCEICLPNTSEFIPWGHHIHGHLFYTGEGKVSVSINRQGTGQNDNLFYAGNYEFLEKGKLLHHVTESNEPDKIGKTRKVDYEPRNNGIVLVVHVDLGKVRLTWSRV